MNYGKLALKKIEELNDWVAVAVSGSISGDTAEQTAKTNATTAEQTAKTNAETAAETNAKVMPAAQKNSGKDEG